MAMHGKKPPTVDGLELRQERLKEGAERRKSASIALRAASSNADSPGKFFDNIKRIKRLDQSARRLERACQKITTLMEEAKGPQQIPQFVIGARIVPLEPDAEVQLQPPLFQSKWIAYANSIPELMPLLKRHSPRNTHVYDPQNTIREKLKAIPNNEMFRTEEQKQLLADLRIIDKYLPYSMRSTYGYSSDIPAPTPASGYQMVYTPQELHLLIAELEKFSRKHRPDFNGIENRILSVIETDKFVGGSWSRKVKGILEREEQNNSTRRGIAWDTMIDIAASAAGVLQGRLSRGRLPDYWIPIIDPEPHKHPNLNAIYRFVSLDHILNILAVRGTNAEENDKETFKLNCQVIDAWFEKTSPIIAELRHSENLNISNIAMQIRILVNSMHERLNGNRKVQPNISYLYASAKAVNLQLRLGHTVDDLLKKLKEESTSVVPSVE